MDIFCIGCKITCSISLSTITPFAFIMVLNNRLPFCGNISGLDNLNINENLYGESSIGVADNNMILVLGLLCLSF